MPNNGKEVKKLYKSFEKLLISKKVLKNNSAKSYYKLFSKVISKKFVYDKTDYSFIDSIKQFNYSQIIHFNEKCHEKIQSLPEYKNSTTYLIEKEMKKMIDNFDQKKWENIYLNNFSKKDFEIEYYKLKTLLLLGMNKSLSKYKVEKPKYSNRRLKKAIIIGLTKTKGITVNNKSVSDLKFKEILFNYILKNKKKALIKIEPDREVKYEDYLKLILKLRLSFNEIKDKLALDFFKKSFESLTKSEKDFILNKYSFETKLEAPK